MQRQTQDPITLAVLAVIEAVEPTPWLDIAMIRVMRDAFLRASAVQEIRWRHVRRMPDQSTMLLRPRETTLSPKTVVALGMVMRERRDNRDDYQFHRDDLVFPVCSKTVTRHIQAAAARAGLSGNYGSDSPMLGMRQDLADHFNLPRNLRTSDGLAASLAPHYIAAIAA